MKKTLSMILAVFMLIGCLSIGTVSAASNAQITLNGKTYSCSSDNTVTYTCKLQSSALVENGQFIINYPSKVLSIADVNFPVVTSPVFNYTENVTDKLKFNFSNINGFDFKSSSTLIEVKFNVIASGSGEISLTKEVLCNPNDANILNTSTFTESLNVGSSRPSAPSPKLNATNKSLKAGKTFQIKIANVGSSKVSYKSSNDKYAKVSSSGKVTAIQKGTAKITVTVGSKKLTCKISVTSSPKLDKKSIKVKKGKSKTVKITGKASSIKNTYKNTKIAKITSKKTATSLKVRGLKKGTTTLKIKVNGKVTLKLKVKVVKK